MRLVDKAENVEGELYREIYKKVTLKERCYTVRNENEFAGRAMGEQGSEAILPGKWA
jgi:hypothetical protein